MSANFTPIFGGYRQPGAFKFWCQKVLPLVYDDSLSYYELLCKVVDYINNLIHDNSETIENMEALLTAYNQLQDYVNTYFANLDLTGEVSNKINEMADDGDLLAIIQPALNTFEQYLVTQSAAQQTYNEQTRATVTASIAEQTAYNTETRNTVTEGILAQDQYNRETRTQAGTAINQQNTYNQQTRDMVSAMVGHPFTASTSGQMTDTTKIYVYTGTTTATLTNGHWYYYNGSVWADGGTYNSTAVEIDSALRSPGEAADAGAVGERLGYFAPPLEWTNGYKINHTTGEAETVVSGNRAITDFINCTTTKDIIGFDYTYTQMGGGVCEVNIYKADGTYLGYIVAYPQGGYFAPGSSTGAALSTCPEFQKVRFDINLNTFDSEYTARTIPYYYTDIYTVRRIGTDKTLKDMDVPADAKAVGDELTLVKQDINELTKLNIPFSVPGLLNKDYGTVVGTAGYSTTPFIPLSGIFAGIGYHVKSFKNIAVACLYDASQAFISSISIASETLVDTTGIITDFATASYIRFCSDTGNSYVPELYISKLESLRILGKVITPANVTFSDHDPVTNLIDPQSCTLGYVNGDTDGSIHSSTTFYVTPFIPLKAGKQYYFNTNYMYRGYYAFYNANKEYISGGGSSSSDFIYPPFTPPTGAAYGRFTIVSQAHLAKVWMCETNQMAEKPPAYEDQIQTKFISEKPTDYSGEDIGVFTKILCIGDSLTDGFFNESGGSRLIIRQYSYPAKLQELTGVECSNMGYAGYTSAQWYAEYSSADLSGHDACIIQLGVNDALNNVSESDMDAALTNIINKVKNENKGIKIFVATIIPANGYMTTTMRTRSQMIRDYVESLNDSDVYLVDMWVYGHTDDLLAFDAGHLSAYGYWQLAKDYKAYISYIIRNNPNAFRYVQFIGTNYIYNGDSTARSISY